MPRLKLVRADRPPDLYRTIRFDPEVETLAFRKLAELDLDGARAAFGRLVDRLDFGSPGPQSRPAILLLLDLLQRVNRRLHRPLGEDADYHGQRVALLDLCASIEDPEDARQAFIPALNRLLAPLQLRPSAIHPLVERAQTYIEDNYQRRLGLSGIARELHVSPNYLSRLFRKETGSTLTDYVHRARLEQARLLLAAGGHSISEIAYMVGYQTYRDFYRNFVKHEHASPRQAQRRLTAPPQGASDDGRRGQPR